MTLKRRSCRGLLTALLALALGACTLPPPVQTVSPAPKLAEGSFACGGALEADTWALWQQRGLPFLRDQLIAKRLQGNGDTYALYDMQTFFDNLAALAERCQRPERMRQMADALMPVFDQLGPLPGDSAQRAWVCRGGAVCNTQNRLVNTEVMLVSAQGLGLMSHLAQMMAASSDAATRQHPFVATTAQVAAQHLLRWGDAKARADWLRNARAQPGDVKDGSSALFFTDKPLWMIDIYANLAGIDARRPVLTNAQRQALGGALRDALVFFKARIALHATPVARTGGALGADIDSGYWRLLADNRYAGYDGATPPALCAVQPDGRRKAQLQVSPRDVPVVPGLGWDISHARRLVHALAALDDNRQAIQAVYALALDVLPAQNLPQAFAAQLVGKVWNGDRQHPLFANYWSGANGWYRVAYDNGTAYCEAGRPPFGLSDSFATGGYISWARYRPVLGELGRQLYHMAQSGSGADQAFIRQYYGGLLAISADSRMLTQLMFWPSLIGA